MTLEKIGNVNSIYDNKKANSVKKTDSVSKSDSLEISSEGLRAAEEAKYVQFVKDAPDVRSEKIQELKAKIADGSFDRYIDDNVLNKIADKLVKGAFKE